MASIEDNLREELKEKCNQIESNNKMIEKILKEKEISMKYNKELRNELKLLSAKLHLHQSVIKTITSCAETQTDEDMGCTEALVCHKCHNPLNSSDKSTDGNVWRQNSETNNTRISDLVRVTAEEVVKRNDIHNDYEYDEKSKTYYSRSSGWYYYPDSYLFYDTNTKNYYKYDSLKKVYHFYSSLQQMDKKRENFTKSSKSSKCSKSSNSKKLKKSIENSNNNSTNSEVEAIELSSSEEEGEIDDSDDNSVISDESIDFDDDINEDKSEVSPPLVRLIVKQSTTLEIGSLLLVTCMGAKVGNDSNCDVWITDESVSRSHAEIRYDSTDHQYLIKDLNSTNGTFTNGTKIKSDCEEVLKHCDEISFGKCVLLVHIHWGRDVTCDRCEPGLVIANLKSNTNETIVYEMTDRESDRKKQLKTIKKKYGLKDIDFCEPKVPMTTNSKYKDRAHKRREEKGSDNPYEKTAAGTSLDTALSDSNKGFQMLSKMGWTSGQALGKTQKGIVEPINVINSDLGVKAQSQ